MSGRACEFRAIYEPFIDGSCLGVAGIPDEDPRTPSRHVEARLHGANAVQPTVVLTDHAEACRMLSVSDV